MLQGRKVSDFRNRLSFRAAYDTFLPISRAKLIIFNQLTQNYIKNDDAI